MKNLYFLLILAFLISGESKAQTLIAVTNETGSSFYSNLDSAIIHSVAGDYIYLPGGNFTVSKPINKKLQIVGVGHNPDSCAVTGITQVTGNFTINSGSDHGSITGLKIWGSISFVLTTGQTLNYFSVEHCNLNGVSFATNSSNILINECVIGSVSGSSSQGILVSKCIISGGISGFVSNTFISNNVFLSSSFTYPYSGVSFQNNIFLSSGPTPTVTYTAFYRNNSFTTAVSSLYNCHNNIVGSAAELFKNKTKTGFDYDQDYHILATSPAHNAGTDGTDLGIYGTGSPWKEGSLPGNPHVQRLRSQSVSSLNGNLDVKVKVAAQDF